MWLWVLVMCVRLFFSDIWFLFYDVMLWVGLFGLNILMLSMVVVLFSCVSGCVV